MRSPHSQHPTNTKENAIPLSVRPGDSHPPKHFWAFPLHFTGKEASERKRKWSVVTQLAQACAPNQLFHEISECLCSRKLQTWTLQTPPREAETPL